MPLYPTYSPNNPNIKAQDPVTGIYQDVDGTFYLNNGTPIDDYDDKTGAYEEGGSWYTYHGVELKSYDKATGNYQELDGTWYNRDGNEIPEPKPTTTTTTTGGKTPTKPTNTFLYIGIGLLLVGGVTLFLLRKKK